MEKPVNTTFGDPLYGATNEIVVQQSEPIQSVTNPGLTIYPKVDRHHHQIVGSDSLAMQTSTQLNISDKEVKQLEYAKEL